MAILDMCPIKMDLPNWDSGRQERQIFVPIKVISLVPNWDPGVIKGLDGALTGILPVYIVISLNSSWTIAAWTCKGLLCSSCQDFANLANLPILVELI